MNKFIKLLRSVDNIKAGTLFLSLLDIVKLLSLIMQFIMAVSASYVYCYLLFKGGYVFGSVGLSVCLSVDNITQKVMNGLG